MVLSKKYLKIDGNVCGSRVVAGIFKTPGGFVFFDVGWDYASLNPVHNIGQLVSERPGEWDFKNKEGDGFVITELKEDDPLMFDAKEWFSYAEKKGYTEEFMRKQTAFGFGYKEEEVE